jgi:predicted DNA-binding protein (UPF0251 family)
MTPIEIEIALRRWGWVYGERPEMAELPEGAKAPAVHPIARAMEFGCRGTDKRLSVSYRRKVLDGERPWSRDPIPCTETRTISSAAPVAPSQRDGAEIVQRAWLVLRRQSPDGAEALRLQYQVRDTQRAKADAMGIKVGRYREILAEARGWVAGALATVAA